MSGATRSQERRLARNNGQDAPTAGEQDPGLDTLIEDLHGLAINCEPDDDSLLSFEPTDKIMRLTPTSETGHVMLYRSRPTEVMLDWTLTAWRGKAEKKTLSILIQGHGLLPVVAKSGWARSLNQDTSEDIYSPINGTDYTEMAWQLCRSVGCELTPNKGIEPDHRPGYFKASHAEMHLITWFVERYFPRLLEDGAENWRMQLPLFLENILIISNRKSYPCYRKLANRVEELTGVTITIEYRGPDV
jgi:hypothetical protein